jgi:diguanylate cyclase (GGDEF)-like protein
MKQSQISFDNASEALDALKKLKSELSDVKEDKLLIQVLCGSLDSNAASQVAQAIDEEFPGSFYVGCSTCGNIMNGDLSKDDYVIVCTEFESPTAEINVTQYHLDNDNVDEVIPKVVKFANENKWIKAIMLYTTVWDTSMSSFCRALESVRQDVEILGGGAFNDAMDSFSSFVFSKGKKPSDNSIAFVFLGGEDLVVHTRYICGWKPLGRAMTITKANGNLLEEVDGTIAFDVYKRYLKIENDENFLSNTVEFPYLIRCNGIEILRHPLACNKDGALLMASDVELASKIRLAYGDSMAILENIYKNAMSIREEDPDVIMIFSCAGRKAYWGDDEIGNETRAFRQIAPSSGFYTLSEFLRTGEHVNQHNITLVIASTKEDIPGRVSRKPVDTSNTEHSGRRMSTVERLANFIEEATGELEAANIQLSDMNQQLRDMAVTDGMTQIYNRTEIQRRITECTETECTEDISLIMLDLDDFKKVNDIFGHTEGDIVIKAIARVIKEQIDDIEDSAAGRWGGEEFMILLPGVDTKKAYETAEKIREAFATITFPQAGNRTVSLGVTQRRNKEDGDSLVLRVDRALYEAKHQGKNMTISL